MVRSANDAKDLPNSHQPCTHGFTNRDASPVHQGDNRHPLGHRHPVRLVEKLEPTGRCAPAGPVSDLLQDGDPYLRLADGASADQPFNGP